ncbi:ribosomal protein S9/S16 [Sodiomyces alkalinus F11]|uniref:Small ribosomal subunit protein uS9m n=1 Tax=Sodiomyces alkalinus (strain CBS 110278 / VKM F-3762 / F11) TaxID=1314773 RepID=A0A3N2Q2I0_SODAK|nr:ribosomal protein S9/S16 [Sodiomyces alkalinus F11]ROT40825.1 ribosomal protein S9/S16 [Sodiomyces alkalinus F11]
MKSLTTSARNQQPRTETESEDASAGSLIAGSRKGPFEGVTHVRPMPVSPSYFSREPHFTDSIVRLATLLHRYQNLPVVAPDQERKPQLWKTLLEYRVYSGEPIKALQYSRALSIVKRLHQIDPKLMPAEVKDALVDFEKDIDPFSNVPKPIPVDRFGRAVGVGRRKTSTARAWVVEGTGEVQINGKPLNEAFGRIHDRESAVWALRSTDRVDKYNIWALVEGGGTTGQAEALTLAIAKGLLAHEPALKPILRQAGCITRDPRAVERKKHGHVKARKMPAWVKR